MKLKRKFIEIVFLLERCVDELMTKQIEDIEDAFGNEVYFFSLTNNRKQLNCQNHFNEQQQQRT